MTCPEISRSSFLFPLTRGGLTLKASVSIARKASIAGSRHDTLIGLAIGASLRKGCLVVDVFSITLVCNSFGIGLTSGGCSFCSIFNLFGSAVIFLVFSFVITFSVFHVWRFVISLFPFDRFSLAGITCKLFQICSPLTFLPFNGTMWSICHLNPVSYFATY